MTGMSTRIGTILSLLAVLTGGAAQDAPEPAPRHTFSIESARETIDALVAADKRAETRQVGIGDGKGEAAAFTGKKCGEWAGEKVGKHHVCLGNLLKGEEVVEAMSAAFEQTKGRLARRMIAAMEAGEKAGGDKRGKQSAAILVVREKGGYLGFDDRAIDLRVDDHTQPIQELARILKLAIE